MKSIFTYKSWSAAPTFFGAVVQNAKRLRVIFAAAFMLAALSAGATDYYWSGDTTTEGGAGTWNASGLNFSTSAAGPFDTAWTGTAGDNVIFEGTGGAVAFSGVALRGAMFVKSNGYTFPSGGTLSLSSTGATNDVADGVTNTISGTLAGSGGALIKNGNGVMILNAINSYTGGTFLNAGTLGWGANTTTIGANSAGVKIIINADNVKFANSSTAGKTPQQAVDQLGDLICDDSLIVNPGIITFSGAQGPWTLTNGDRKISVNGAASLSISAVLKDDGTPRSLTKAGSGLLTLGGNNTYGGTTTIQTNGALKVTHANGLGATSAGTVVESGGSLQVGVTGIAEPITLNGTGVTNTGALRSVSTTPNFSGPITLGSSGVRINSDTSTLTLSGGITGAGNNLTIGGSGSVLITNSAIATVGGSLTKDGSGTLTLTLANSYSGGTTINAGKISVGDSSALGTGAVTVSSGNTSQQLIINTAGLNISNPLTMSVGGGVAGQGIIYYNQTTGSATYSGALTLNGVASTGGQFASGAGGELILTGQITSSSLVTIRNGVVTLSNPTNNFSSMSIQAGTCKLGVVNGIPASATVDMGGSGPAIIDLNGFNQTVAGITKNVNSATVINGGAGTPTLTMNNSSSVAFAGVLGGGGTNFNFTKTGNGFLTLGGTNTYTGTTLISAGTLNVTNTGGSATGTNAVTVTSTASLTGNGIISGSVAVNGTISPGTNAVGTLSTGNETWAGGGHYTFEINSAAGTAGTNPGWDTLNITGALNITATSAGKFNIDINSLTLANTAGAVSDFNSASNYTWSIVHTTTGISGFDANAFALSAASFSNSIGSGTFSITTNATDVLLNFTTGSSAQPPTSFVETVAGQGHFNGSPNTSYTIQYANNLNSPINWQTLTTATTDNSGLGSFTDPAPATGPQRYYRVKSP